MLQKYRNVRAFLVPGSCSLFAFCLVLARVIYLCRLEVEAQAASVPDDAFYYLILARNYVRLGRWTFDGVSAATGFHLLWGYALAGLYWVMPQASLASLLAICGVAGGLLLAISVFLAIDLAQTFFGEPVALGALFVLLSAPSILLPTMMMEASPVLAASAALFYLVFRHPLRRGRGWLGLCFLTGVLGSLSRSDFGLQALVLFGACSIFSRRWAPASAASLRAACALAGSTLGVLIVTFHTHATSGAWVQASASEKLFWSSLGTQRFLPALRLFLLPLRPGFDEGRPLVYFYPALAIVALLLGIGLREVFRRPETRSARPLALGAVLTVFAYVILYRWNSEALQVWYLANVLIALSVCGVLILFPLLRRLRSTTWRVAVALLVLVWSVRGIRAMQHPVYLIQVFFYRNAVALRSFPHEGPVGAWNAGVLAYYSGKDIINLDGLVNDDILPYSKSGTLADYLLKRHISLISDMRTMWIPRLRQRGGYADGRLDACKKPDLTLPDQYDLMVTYHIDLDCLRGSGTGAAK